LIGKVFLATAYTSLLQEVVEGIPIRVFWKDINSQFLGCNSLFAKDAGFTSPQDIIGKTDFDLVWHEQAAGYRDDDRLVMDSGEAKLNYEEKLTTFSGNIIYLRTSKVPLRDADQNIIGILGIYEDITARKHAEEMERQLTRALKLISKCNAALIHAENEMSLLADICRLTVDVGGYQLAWVGYPEQDIAKSVRPIAQSGYDEDFLNSLAISWDDIPHGRGPTGTAIRTGKTVVNANTLTNPTLAPWFDTEFPRHFYSSIALPLKNQNQIIGVLSIYAAEPDAFGSEEVTLLEELASDLAFGINTLRTRHLHDAAEKKLAFLAHFDPLTHLPNRTLLRDRFNQAVVVADQTQTAVALFYLDLDNFTNINDSLGHACGDQLLIQVAERLQTCIGKTDTLSRQSGDEFVILLTDIGGNISLIETIIQNILSAFSTPFSIDSYTLNMSCSIGISLYPQDERTFDTLLTQADTALYHAKHAGRNTYRFFDEKMNSQAMAYMQLQTDLHHALQNNELRLHYQPQLDAVTQRIKGVEALLRWEHPQHGMISPATFIPSAEQSGLIIPIGEWVLNEACQQTQRWRNQCHEPALIVAVNLSALQFKRGNLVKTITQALEQSGLPPENLELELTESILLHDMNEVRKTLHQLTTMGVRLSIDDFGTGYSSLAYLKQLEVDKLKVDQSFVHDMVSDYGDAAIVKAIIQLGHTLDLDVIAEGVETKEQLALLKEYGIDEIQGYLFSRPLPAEQFIEFYNQRLI
jgi:PAS domain S-box/diguanylate cyclase (GGDEF) domain